MRSWRRSGDTKEFESAAGRGWGRRPDRVFVGDVMTDPRLEALADILINHSIRLKRGEKVLIESFDLEDPTLVCTLVRKAAEKKAVPLVSTKQNRVLRELYRWAGEEGMRLAGQVEKYRMERVQAYIGVRGALNVSETTDVAPEKMNLYQTHWWQPVHIDVRVRKTKWVVLRWPTASMAQLAGMSTEAFEDFYFKVCTADYASMARALKPLVRLMGKTDRVEITGPDTELAFSIKGIPIVPCAGDRNIPDGEAFTAPVRDSINGVITFNAPTIYQGNTFERVRLEFEKGKIVKATCAGDGKRLNAVFDSDEGARYVGEWSIGCNPHILHPMKDILFDEKIAGSMHLTPGKGA